MIKIEVITDPEEQVKIQPELEAIKKAALEPTKFELGEKEIANFEKFKEKHGIGKCDAFADSTGGCFIFSFMPSGLGMNTWVECSCGAKEYLTDLSYLDEEDDVYCPRLKHTVYQWVCLENCSYYKNNKCSFKSSK